MGLYVEAFATSYLTSIGTSFILISAFAGRENILRAYREAVAEHYRFLSFGDAMLII
jgi:S-adenosylmethionine:tRNA ribosyltransferase-isomerase